MAPIEVLVLSWNVGNKQPNAAELEAWLPAGGGSYDLVAVGTQENDFKEEKPGDEDEEDDDDRQVAETNVAAETRDVTLRHRQERLMAAKAISKNESAWDAMVSERLGANYGVVAHQVMWQMRLTLYAKSEHLGGPSLCIDGVQAAQSATGLGGVLANKGGIVIKLDFGHTSLAFVSCHLAAHSHKLQRRNADCQEVLEETRRGVGRPQVDVLHQFDHVFWLGDLNYRVDLNLVAPTTEDEHFASVSKLIDASDWKALMAADQLRSCQAKGEAFAGFTEGQCDFAPTFKVERKDGMHYKNKRIPSYCDRILWKSMPALKGHVEQKLLCSAPSVSTSDHKPVFAHFSIASSPAVRSAPEGAQPPLIQLQHASVDGVSATDKTYLVFLTNPDGLLGDAKQKPPRTMSVASRKSAASPSRLAASWAAEQCPMLRPLVADPLDLARTTLIVAVYDADVLSEDDLLGTVLIPLARPDGPTAVSTDEEYELDVELPIVMGAVSADKGVFKAKLKVSYGGKLAPALEAAVGLHETEKLHSGGCCAVQ